MSKRQKLLDLEADEKHYMHGTTSGYGYGCRCWRCKVAHSKALRIWKANCLKEMQADINDKRHGTWTGYCYGCRCDRCKKASVEYNKKG